ncbi:MAG: outer membrane protein assembly factor, partial [Planctomycetaceae bacterium]|nr:outer membrane protein assembly factor [Planctomycetaceae bacterium]
SEQNFDLFRYPRSFQDIIDRTAFRGGGQRFRFEAIPGNQVSRYLVNWTDPYFMDTDFSLGVSGFYYQRFFSDWNEQRGGGRISVGRQFNPYWSASAALRLENVEITDPDFPTPQLLLDALGDNFLSTIRLSVVHDTRDSGFLPGSGHKIEVGYEQAFNDFTYARFDADARQYFTLYNRPDGGGRHILTVGGQVGYTGNDTPIFERYFAGGFQTFRGFAFRGVGPQQFDVRVGGQFLALGSLEYMFPLLVNESVQAVAFTDFGTVEEDVGLDQFRMSVGAGLRVSVPALGPVPLAFDWAVPIFDEDTDDRRIFSFYVGLNR